MSPVRRTALVLSLAVCGIALAAAITLGTSQLVRQRIGLASEPLSAGQRLLPRAASGTTPAGGPRTRGTGGPSTPRREGTTPRTSSTTPLAPASAGATTSTTTSPPPVTATGVEGAPSSEGRSSSEGGDASSRRDD